MMADDSLGWPRWPSLPGSCTTADGSRL